MKRYIAAIFSAVIAFCLLSCHRQKLEEPYLFLAHIPVSIDWSKSLLDMKQVGNVSLYFYPKDGGEPVVKVSDNLHYNLIGLPIGEYSVLVFNDMVNDVTGISYRHEATYNRFSVNMIEQADYVPGFYEVGANELIVAPHNRMAEWHMSDFVVDESLVQYTRSEEFKDYITKVESRAETRLSASMRATTQSGIGAKTRSIGIPSTAYNTNITKASVEALEELSNIVTQPKTTVINYRIRVKNLNSAMQFKAYMKGVARGTYLAQDINISADGDKRNVYDLTVTNREYDNPNKGIDGYVNFSLNTFGREPIDEKYDLDFIIVLKSGEIKRFERDITDQIVQDEDQVIKIELVDEDNQLILPANTEAGFNVDGWGDDITLYL